MVCDCLALSKITTSDANSLLLITEALDQVSVATVFSKIDLLVAYHQMQICDEDNKKTATRTRYGSFELTVSCLGVTNTPASFTRLLPTLLRDLNGEWLVIFLDDILVNSCNLENHKKYLRALSGILKKEQL